MDSPRRYIQVVLFVLVTSPFAAFAQTTFDARSSGSLGKVRISHGKRKLHVISLNPVRYKYLIAREVTITAGPDLSKIPGIPPLGEASATVRISEEPCTEFTTIDQIKVCIDTQFYAKNEVLGEI